jgi:hypothetical protein
VPPPFIRAQSRIPPSHRNERNQVSALPVIFTGLHGSRIERAAPARPVRIAPDHPVRAVLASHANDSHPLTF